MPVPTKPTDHTEFDLTQTNTVKPQTSLIDNGYVYGDAPSSQNFNWILNNSYLWENYFDNLLDFILIHLIFDDANNILKLSNSGTTYETLEVSNYDGDVNIKSHDDATTPVRKNEFKLTPKGIVTTTSVTTNLQNLRVTPTSLLYRSGMSRSFGYNFGVNEYQRIVNAVPSLTPAQIADFQTKWANATASGQTAFVNGGAPDLSAWNTSGVTGDELFNNDEVRWYTNTEKFGSLNISSLPADTINGFNEAYLSFGCQLNQTDNRTRGFVTDLTFQDDEPAYFSNNKLIAPCAIRFRNGGINTFTGAPSSAHGAPTVMTIGPYLSNQGTSWTSSSDERMKTIIRDVENAVERLTNLRTVEAYFNSDTNQTIRPVLIAQDVLEQFPTSADVPSNYDEDMSDNHPDFEPIGVNYQDMIPVLIAAIKEQQGQITALEARVEALENG
jgi:hypothetical protein